jgi:hypothetical protein
MVHDTGDCLWPLACWDCGFESRQGHECLTLWNDVCCQVQVSASGWSLVQRSPTEPGVCVSLGVVKCKNKPLHIQPIGKRGQTENKRKKGRQKKEINIQTYNCSRMSFNKFQKYKIWIKVISSKTTWILKMGAKSRNTHQSWRRLPENIRTFILYMGTSKPRKIWKNLAA